MKTVSKERLQSLIQEKLALIIEKEMNDNALHRISITDVILSGDERTAKVYYDMYGDESAMEAVHIKLEKLKGYIRNKLGKTMKIRRLPDIIFERDTRMEMEEKIEKIIHGDDNGQQLDS